MEQPEACYVATADFIISSPLFHEEYERTKPDLGPRNWEQMRGGE